jgi:hypothetical protein
MHKPSKTRLHYIDLNPEPLESEPSATEALLMALISAAVVYVLVWLAIALF